MYKYKFSILFFLISISTYSQRFYDSNDLEYFIDFSSGNASLKFQEFRINGPIEDILSHYGNRYTVIKGDSIHWLLQQSKKRNKYSSYLILKGEYKEVRNLAKWEFSNKKLDVLASDYIFTGYFKDHFNFVDENEYEKIRSNRKIGNYLADSNLFGKYKIKIFKDNDVNYLEIDIKGTLEINQNGIVIETNLPTLTRFYGTYVSELNTNINLIKKGTVVGKIEDSNWSFFSLSIDINNKIGTLTTLLSELNEELVETNRRNTTTFIITE